MEEKTRLPKAHTETKENKTETMITSIKLAPIFFL